MSENARYSSNAANESAVRPTVRTCTAKERYDKKRRLKYRRRFLSRVCADVCRRRVYVVFR